MSIKFNESDNSNYSFDPYGSTIDSNSIQSNSKKSYLDNLSDKIPILKEKPVQIILLIFIFLLALFFIFSFLSNQDQIKSKLVDLSTTDSNSLSFKGSISLNGNFVDTFSSDGNTLTNTLNPNNSSKMNLSFKIKNNSQASSKSTLSSSSISMAKIKLTTKDGNIITINLPSDAVSINENGEITINYDLINLEDYNLPFDEITLNDSFVFDLQLEIINGYENGDEEKIVIEVPVEIIFQEFVGSGCLLFDISSVSSSTPYGKAEVDFKLKMNCESSEPLLAYADWQDYPKGTIELYLNGYPQTIDSYSQVISSSLNQSIYNGKLIFTPNSSQAGKFSDFDLFFSLANSTQSIPFHIVNENLAQCLSISSTDSIIENASDTASITVDAKKCFSKVDISLCYGDASCSGGTEGGIIPSEYSFSLSSSNPSKTIQINRMDIAGQYGVTVYASVSSFEKEYIGEQEILVLPTNESIFPDKFSISVLETNSKDSIKLINSNLLGVKEVETNVCNLVSSSLDIDLSTGVSAITGNFTSTDAWYNYLLGADYYAGEGFYQRAMFSSLPNLLAVSETVSSVTENEFSLIKDAYLNAKPMNKEYLDVVNSSDASLEAVDNLEDKSNEVKTTEETDLAVQLASISTSAYTIYSSSTSICASVSADLGSVTVWSGPALACGASSASASIALAKITAAETLSCGELALQSKSLYDSVQALMEPPEEIDISSSVSNTSESNELMQEIEFHLSKMLEYLDKAMQYASIDSTYSVSSDLEKAKEYLSLAQTENDFIKEKISKVRELQLTAEDDLTVLIDEDAVSKADQIQMYIQMADQAKGLIESMTADNTALGGLLSTTSTSLSTAGGAAAAQCATVAGCASSCSGVSVDAALNVAQIANTQALITDNSGNLASAMGYVSAFTTAYGAYQMLNQDYVDELIDTKTANALALEKSDSLYVSSSSLVYDLENAIKAAENISKMSESSSDLSKYDLSNEKIYFNDSLPDFKSENFSGFLSTLLSTSFINSAYLGGVYTTADTSFFSSPASSNPNSNQIHFSDIQDLVENCENKVKLTLPYFKTNLIKDAKTPILSNSKLKAYYSFADAKVNGFFDSQEIDLIFLNDSMKRNGYVTVEIPYVENSVDDTISKKFKPFSVSSSKEEKSVKFHFKVNANIVPSNTSIKPKSIYLNQISDSLIESQSLPILKNTLLSYLSSDSFNSSISNSSFSLSTNSCNKNLLLGNTSSYALPKVSLSWAWSDLNENLLSQKYLDATQFSIILAKKLSELNEILKTKSGTCPSNPSYKVLDAIVPNVIAASKLSVPSTQSNSTVKPSTAQTFVFDKSKYLSDSSCFLPFSTTVLDSKPALLYFFNDSSNELANSISFNSFLMKDGYGTDFQTDFTYFYKNKLFASSPDFKDPLIGFAKYFDDSDYLFFTTKKDSLMSNEKIFLPNAGLYKVNLLIDYDKLNKNQLDSLDFSLISSSGAINSNVAVEFYLIDPLANGYSPMYYTPIDGMVGEEGTSNRFYYGSSLSNSSNDFFLNSQFSLLSGQSDTLSNLSISNLEDIFVLNALNSKRGLLLDFSKYQINQMFTYATPILLNISNSLSSNPSLIYSVYKGDKQITSSLNNFLILNGLSSCKLDSTLLSSLVDNAPDVKSGNNYGLSLPVSDSISNFPFTSFVYSPSSSGYSMAYFGDGEILSSDNSNISGTLNLSGISGMSFNSQSSSSTISNLSDLFNLVESGAVCISSSSNSLTLTINGTETKVVNPKNLFYWNEDYLSKKEGSTEKSLESLISQYKAKCTK
ncbi:MAG: hypothetical protein PHQ98_04060 [Candidatus ainarchaeum sp.]|nr:hypothetical protein [Candidatus ainarchaeum sp.]